MAHGPPRSFPAVGAKPPLPVHECDPFVQKCRSVPNLCSSGALYNFFFSKGYYTRVSGLINLSHVGSDPRLIHASALACDLQGCF